METPTARPREAAQHGRRRAVGADWHSSQADPSKAGLFDDVGDCILLFGGFCNGNMGDVVQPIAMQDLLASVAPDQCFWYAHPADEDVERGYRIGEFFGGDDSKVFPLTPDLAWKVNRFKALVIGGGGIFAAIHQPLPNDQFVEALTLPIVVMGVGASSRAMIYSKLLSKAVFVSGRDETSIQTFKSMLGRDPNATVAPDDVALVRDPVLSDKMLSDKEGSCWKRSAGDDQQPLCFVVPAANTQDTTEMHEHLLNAVRQGDRFINVFPKHQKEIEKFAYPGTVEQIVDPMEYVEQLCNCKAIISTRLHGVVLGLHMSVPTFAAFRLPSDNKFLQIDKDLDRDLVNAAVSRVRQLYEEGDRRAVIHDRLSAFHDEFIVHARHVLVDVLGVGDHHQQQQGPDVVTYVQQAQIDNGLLAPQAAVSAAAALNGTPAESSVPSWSHKMMPASVGLDCVAALFLLFAIIALAALPSKTGGGRGGGRIPRVLKSDAANGDKKGLIAVSGMEPALGKATAHQEMEEHCGMTDAASPSSFRDSELGSRDSLSPAQRSPATKQSGFPATKKGPSLNFLFALNFILWIALAVAFSRYSKSYLRDTQDPVGLLVLQGSVGVVVLCALGRLGLGATDEGRAGGSVSVLGQLVQPFAASRLAGLAAILHTCQAFLTSFSVFVGGVAVTSALKATEPVAAVAFSHLILGKTVHRIKLASLAVIMAGIVLLTTKSTATAGTAHEAAEEGGATPHSPVVLAAMFTMAAVCCNALRNVLIKKGDPVPPRQTLLACSLAAAAIGVSLMALRVVMRSMDDLLLGPAPGGVVEAADAAREGNGASWLSMEGVNAALCFVGYNLASFNLLAQLSPVGHAVGNSVKRVVMFGSGILLMGEVMTGRQLGGTAVALTGVLVYNLVGSTG
ncbi:conserved unknown protein [Ectocarpus siliculosus]|uniref:Sugar phosphate transporter domain-containing protein n=1 Tax=Ectocarpus siliculosus TaxID=2880 RepID=D7FIC7_ECTSI|nr:conserved unknown protein [Ectocarpus siliculosus]|eukprot:CBJ28751.1 conserved unknown protein [Ectocarpus siliculosus]